MFIYISMFFKNTKRICKIKFSFYTAKLLFYISNLKTHEIKISCLLDWLCFAWSMKHFKLKLMKTWLDTVWSPDISLFQFVFSLNYRTENQSSVSLHRFIKNIHWYLICLREHRLTRVVQLRPLVLMRPSNWRRCVSSSHTEPRRVRTFSCMWRSLDFFYFLYFTNFPRKFLTKNKCNLVEMIRNMETMLWWDFN